MIYQGLGAGPGDGLRALARIYNNSCGRVRSRGAVSALARRKPPGDSPPSSVRLDLSSKSLY